MSKSELPEINLSKGKYELLTNRWYTQPCVIHFKSQEDEIETLRSKCGRLKRLIFDIFNDDDTVITVDIAKRIVEELK